MAPMLFNLSRPRRLIELSNLTQTASRATAENTRSIGDTSFAPRLHGGGLITKTMIPLASKIYHSKTCRPLWCAYSTSYVNFW